MNRENKRPRIIIDADACPRPALEICRSLGREYKLGVCTVASFAHNIEGSDHYVVGNDPQETDIKMTNLARPGDIAVTEDLGLAAMLLGKGVRCISPRGRIIREDSIEFMLEELDLKKKYRRSGGRLRGPAPRKPEMDRLFSRNLRELIIGQLEE